jgi:hypothetical protein
VPLKMREKIRSSRPAEHPSPVALSRAPVLSRTDFYREEFLKHRACLEHQREFFSEQAIAEVECALRRILAELDQLCCREDADRCVAALLRKFDLVTGLSGWIDPRTLN